MKRKLYESELPYSKEERKAFLEIVREYKRHGEQIYRSTKFKELNEEITQLVEMTETFTMQESGEWFDNVTVSRDMKKLKEAHKMFSKTCQEMTMTQQRLESCYEDIGNVLNRYYEID
jgi:hypothetical protein